LGELALRLPNQCLPKISLIIGHLENESYLMRNGIINFIGNLIQHACNNNKDEKKTIKIAKITMKTKMPIIKTMTIMMIMAIMMKLKILKSAKKIKK